MIHAADSFASLHSCSPCSLGRPGQAADPSFIRYVNTMAEAEREIARIEALRPALERMGKWTREDSQNLLALKSRLSVALAELKTEMEMQKAGVWDWMKQETGLAGFGLGPLLIGFIAIAAVIIASGAVFAGIKIADSWQTKAQADLLETQNYRAYLEAKSRGVDVAPPPVRPIEPTIGEQVASIGKWVLLFGAIGLGVWGAGKVWAAWKERRA